MELSAVRARLGFGWFLPCKTVSGVQSGTKAGGRGVRGPSRVETLYLLSFFQFLTVRSTAEDMLQELGNSLNASWIRVVS